VIQALFYGIGPAVIALILRGAWKLVRVSIKDERRLWAIFAVVAVVTFLVRSEVALLFILAGLIGVLFFAPPGWLRRITAVPVFLPFGVGTILSAGPGDPNVLVQLGIFFFKAGAFTFGSGLAIVPFLQQGVVRDFGWLSEREFLDAVAMGMITPGPVVITAVFVGYLVAGLPGATVAGIGVFLPPFLMVVLFAPWIIRFRTHPVVVGFTRGATAAAAGAIVGAAAVIATQVLVDLPTLAIFVVALVAIWSAKIPEPLLVAGAGVVGFVAFAVR
jgi:chromate transporter